MIIVIVLYDVEYDRYTYLHIHICVGGDAGSAKVSFIKLR